MALYSRRRKSARRKRGLGVHEPGSF